MFSYGRDHHKNVRRIDLGGLERRAGSEHYSDVYAAILEGRYHFNIDDLKIEPFVSMRYGRLNIAGFRERGAGDLDLLPNLPQPGSRTSVSAIVRSQQPSAAQRKNVLTSPRGTIPAAR
jgi:hypothetical protein